MNPLHEAALDVLDRSGDWTVDETAHDRILAAWLPNGYGIIVVTTMLDNSGWIGEADVAYGKVTRNDSWKYGTIYNDDVVITAKVRTPAALTLLLTGLRDGTPP